MKNKLFLIAAAMCSVIGANAQLKVNSIGNVGIGTANPQYRLDISFYEKAIRLDSWTDVYINSNSGLCGAPCIYPERDWYLQFGTKEKRVGTIFVQTIHVNKT